MRVRLINAHTHSLTQERDGERETDLKKDDIKVRSSKTWKKKLGACSLTIEDTLPSGSPSVTDSQSTAFVEVSDSKSEKEYPDASFRHSWRDSRM